MAGQELETCARRQTLGLRCRVFVPSPCHSSVLPFSESLFGRPRKPLSVVPLVECRYFDPYPALAPLHSPDEGLCALTGVSLPVLWSARLRGKIVEERERELLFTHKGFSGPAILDASHWVIRDGAGLQVSWGAFDRNTWVERWRADARKFCQSVLAEFLPRRLVTELLRRSRLPDKIRYDAMTNAQSERLLTNLCHCSLPISGDGGFAKAEVTGGGVPIGEVNPSTLESRATPGLYLCGEIFDVIGRIGGYNFLWAWVTGRLAGESASR